MTIDSDWTWNELDASIAEELQGFVPDKVFDMHAHIYRVADFVEPSPVMRGGGAEVTVDVWREHVGRQWPRARTLEGLFLPAPLVSPNMDGSGLDAGNDFLVAQLEAHPDAHGLILVGPQYSADQAARYLEKPRVVGFKPYHCFSTEKPTWEAPLSSFLPEWTWEAAHERGLVITLHMVRERALSDPDNQREIREMCLKYPRAKLVLAHAARGFHTPNTVKGLAALEGLENVWFDTAAVCESAAVVAILRAFGPKRVMWGSDFPVSESRGRAVSLGDGFVWVVGETLDWESQHSRANPTLVGLESLRAMREVADWANLSETDVQDIFYNNARRLLGSVKGE